MLNLLMQNSSKQNEAKSSLFLLLDDRSESEAVLQCLRVRGTLALQNRKRVLTRIRDQQQPQEESFIHCGKYITRLPNNARSCVVRLGASIKLHLHPHHQSLE